ncbi:MAG: Rieske (2Fe-2S) protein [Phycisphaerae bacterium]
MQTNFDKPQTRRGFLDWVVGLGSAATAVAMTVPGVMYLWPAARGGGSEKVEVEGAGNLAPGQSITIQVGSQAVIVVRSRSGFKAFSAVCTHLGCLVKWDPGNKEFLCPCHAAVFDDKGQVVSGPPPAALPELVVREIGGKVYVSSV